MRFSLKEGREMRIVIEMEGSEGAKNAKSVPQIVDTFPSATEEAPPAEILQAAAARGAFSAGPAPAEFRAIDVHVENLARPTLPAEAARLHAADLDPLVRLELERRVADAGAAPEDIL